MYYSIYFLVILRTTVFCFNLEHRDPLVKKAPDGQGNSYFGFSVAQHKTEENNPSKDVNWLLVGAPLGQNLQPGSNHSGALFKCPISNYDDDCEQVETDGRREAGGKYLFNDFDYDDEVETELKVAGSDEIKTGQWLGVTVKSQKPGGIVMVCAHRYIQSPDLSKFHYGQGLCYLLDRNLNTYESLQLCKGRPVEKLHQQFGFCQVGTSASFVGDKFALMGAPGPYTWRGTVFGQVVVGDYLLRDKTTYHGPLSDTDILEKYSYLGMSVGGGHFFNKTAYTYISGAPRSKMKGQVYFFQKHSSEEEFNISLIITGEQFASSFGYELLAADVNNDGYDDLLVGAPFYYGETKGGAVYIYYNVKDCTWSNCTWDKVLYGKPQSRFGFSMTSVGDINKDGYNDVAIGAPYEDNHGAVYIYLGSPNGLNLEPSQVIRIKQLKTFGYSLSGGMDMDNNGYPDLLVGAYESARALLFKTRPIIDINIEIQSVELKNINSTRKGCAADPTNRNYTCFSFKSCFSIAGEIKKNQNFSVRYYIREEKRVMSRIWFLDNVHVDKRMSVHTQTILVNDYLKQYCQDETVYIKDSVSDIISPIKFRVNYTLADNTYHSPILNKTSVKIFEATFQKECGDDEICESYLVLTAGTSLTKNEEDLYRVDSLDQEFVLQADVTNLRESAYEAKLFVVHPSALSYIALQTDKDDPSNIKCTFLNETLVFCDIGNPLRGNRTVNLKLRFEILKDTKEQKLDLKIFVNSTSTEQSKQTSQTVVAVLQKVASFQITGKASSNLFYGGKVIGESAMENLEDIGARVTHKYQIDNYGLWDLPDVVVNIRWPLQVSPGPNSGGKPGKWLLYLESLPEVNGLGIEGYCEVLGNVKINELNLKLSKPSDEPENLMLPDEFIERNESVHVRRKRDVNYVVPMQTTKRGGTERKFVVMDCINGSAKCIDIVCTIRKLYKQSEVSIDIKSRIWNSTLVEDYSNVDWVVIRSNAVVEIGDKSFNVSEASVQLYSAETVAYPEIDLADSALNWWIIGGAILAGLLLLIILVVILYKCGFFKRKRVSNDPTLSGNLQKRPESDHLLTDE